MYRGVLTRRTRFRDPRRRILSVTQRRFVSMRAPALRRARDHARRRRTGQAGSRFVSALDGTVRNAGVARYATLDNLHLVPDCGDRENDEVVCLRSRDQRVTRPDRRGRPHAGVPRRRPPRASSPTLVERPGYVALRVRARRRRPARRSSSRRSCRSSPHATPASASRAMRRANWVRHLAGDFDALLEAPRRELAADSGAAPASSSAPTTSSRGCCTSTSSTCCRRCRTTRSGSTSASRRAACTARPTAGTCSGTSCSSCRSSSLRFPRLARALLLYRYRRLDQARRAATAAGYAGAMFPWQSASNGREETQTMHLNPASGRWLPDASHRQRHVNAAIAYNMWQYFQATGDIEFLRFFGAEMILEIARFWASIATYNHALDRYEIKGVMGPDEYHERLSRPGRARPRQQRLHEPDGGVVPVPGVRRARRRSRRRSARELQGAARDQRAGARPLGRRQPQDAGLLPRRRHQPVRGLRAARGARLGRLPRSATATSSGSIGSSRPRATARTATSSPSRPT